MREPCKHFLISGRTSLCTNGSRRIIAQKWCDNCEKYEMKEQTSGEDFEEMAGKQRIKWDITAKELFPYADEKITLRDHIKKLHSEGASLSELSKKLGVAPNTIGSAIGVYSQSSKAKSQSDVQHKQPVKKPISERAAADLRREEEMASRRDKEEAGHEFWETDCGDYPEAKIHCEATKPDTDLFTAFLNATNQMDMFKGFVIGYEMTRN